MKLMIVESPNKKRTISKLLNSNKEISGDDSFVVAASVGHFRDISSSGKYNLGVDIDSGNFEVNYEVLDNKENMVEGLKTLVNKANEVYLATDPDREGEAISWHLANTLNLDINTTKRVMFNEITPRGVKEAFNNITTINMSMVRSQEARRILDRIIGYRLSYLVKTKIPFYSAGRVQSVVLKLICDREKEIKNFIKEDYYHLFINVNNNNDLIKLQLVDKELKSLDEVNKIINEIDEVYFDGINEEYKSIHAFPPFTTSSLQQEAFYKFGYDSKKTMKIAQELFEGVKGHQGLITYMRTDSIRLSPIFIASAKNYIKENFGEQYVGKAYVQKSSNGVQDAHEAIRPTDLKFTPNAVKEYLNNDQYNLYELIFNRAICSIMANKEVIDLTFNAKKDDYKFISKRQKLIFDGFEKLNKSNTQYSSFDLNVNDKLTIVNKEYEKLETKPKPRYNSASIVKLMEESGIGRPSTYASTIENLKKHNYIKINKKGIVPTEEALIQTDFLLKYFDDLMDVNYTANMENLLDEIQNYTVKDIYDREKEIEVLNIMNDVFVQSFKKALDNEENYVDAIVENEFCPKCGAPLVTRFGKYGKYITCQNYKETCDYIKPKEVEYLDKVCPECGSPLSIRKGRYGKFIGCSNYPKCKYTEKIKK